MSEGTHSVMSTKTALTKQRFALLAVGTLIVLVVAGVLIQVLRAKPGEAQTNATTNAKAQNPQVKNGRYMARVNNDLIDWDTVASECVARYGRDVLENIINRVIIQQACQERGIKVTEAEVNTEIMRFAKRFNLPVDTWLQMIQTERNLSPTQYKRDVIWPMIALKKIAGTKINVTEDDMKKAFIRDYGPRVKAKMIMLDNFRRAQTVWDEVAKDPKSFERLARQHSIEPTSRALGGQIPPIRRFSSQGQEQLELEAFKLKANEISGIIQVGMDRYVILLSEGRTEPIVTDINDVKATLYEQIMEEKVQMSINHEFDALKKKARVDNYLTNISTGGVRQASGTQNKSGVQPAHFSESAEKAQPGRFRPNTSGVQPGTTRVPN